MHSRTLDAGSPPPQRSPDPFPRPIYTGKTQPPPHGVIIVHHEDSKHRHSANPQPLRNYGRQGARLEKLLNSTWRKRLVAQEAPIGSGFPKCMQDIGCRHGQKGCPQKVIACTPNPKNILRISGRIPNCVERACDLSWEYLADLSYSVGYCQGRRWSVPSSRTPTGFVPRIVDHDGIENRFVGKASVLWYWFGESRSSFRERTDASGCNNGTTVARKSAAVQRHNIWHPAALLGCKAKEILVAK